MTLFEITPSVTFRGLSRFTIPLQGGKLKLPPFANVFIGANVS